MAAEAGGGGDLHICPKCKKMAVPDQKCIRCRVVLYCSSTCRITHWEKHKKECMKMITNPSVTTGQSTKISNKRAWKQTNLSVPTGGSTKIPNKIPFPREEFVRLFLSAKLGRPLGLSDAGNSCFANAVFQCLAYTQPLSAYLLGEGHKKNCKVSASCFFCEFQTLMETVNNRIRTFYPIKFLSILSPAFNFAERQDAHDYMRFAIKAMQSACHHEYGGENIVQHIFGGRLQYQVKCTRCNTVPNISQDMVVLHVEIDPDAESLNECLHLFTAEEYIDSKVPCPSCQDHVMARQKTSVERAPNILTIALKRDEDNRDQTVRFPEKLDLRCYMSDSKRDDENYEYKLYAVVINTDFHPAISWSHYISYVKDFSGNWYKVDDYKVRRVFLPEVLEQDAYMLLYSRTYPRIMDVESVTREAMRPPAFPINPNATCSSSTPTRIMDVESVTREAMRLAFPINPNATCSSSTPTRIMDVESVTREAMRLAFPINPNATCSSSTPTRIMDVESVSREAMPPPAFPINPNAPCSSSTPTKLRMKPISSPPLKVLGSAEGGYTRTLEPVNPSGSIFKQPRKRLLDTQGNGESSTSSRHKVDHVGADFLQDPDLVKLAAELVGSLIHANPEFAKRWADFLDQKKKM